MITNNDLDWLESFYPGMVYIPKLNILRGCLWFRILYRPIGDVCIINPEKNEEGDIFLEDAYELDVEFNEFQSSAKARETAGRLKWSAKKWRADLIDIHVYSNSSLCLHPPPEDDIKFSDGFSIKSFFKKLLIPDLFYQSYFEKTGREPWRGSSHGDLGILESYKREFLNKMPPQRIMTRYLEFLSISLRNTILEFKSLKKNNLCLCKSGRLFQNCHQDAFAGYKKLYNDFSIINRNTK